MPGPGSNTLADDEAVAVRCWVFDRLLEDERFSAAQATLLVAANADYHRALAMLESGCSAELVVAILT